MYEISHDALGGRLVDRSARRRLRAFRRTTIARRDHAADAVVFLTNPNNPSGTVVPLGRPCARSRATSRPALVFVDEAYAEFAGEYAHRPRRCSRRSRTSSSAARSRRPSASPACASARSSAHPATLEPMRQVGAAVQPQRLGRRGAPGRARGPRVPRLVSSRRSRESRALLADACARLGLRTGRARPTSCWSASATARRRSSTALAARGVCVRDRSSEPGCAGCIRITAGLVDHTRRAIAALEEVLCAARVIDRRTRETQIRADARPRGPGPLRRRDRHPLPRSHAGARRAAWRVRPRRCAPTATSTSISITPSRTSASRSAKRSPARSATAAASTAPATS